MGVGLIRIDYATRAAWAADRRSGPPWWSLGATDAASILGVGWGDQWTVWAAGQGEAPADEPNDVMLRGSEWEPLVVRWYEGHFARRVDSRLCRVVHPDAEWLRPSPDGIVLDGDEPAGLIEIKCPRLRDGWGKDGVEVGCSADGVGVAPVGYLVQVYAQLAASGLPWCDLIACWGPQDTRVLRVHADPAYQARLVSDLAEWRERHLVRGETPEIDASDACGSWMAALRPEGVREATPEEAAELLEIRQLRIDGDSAIEEAKRRARVVMAAANSKTIYGPGVRATLDTRGAVRIT